MRSIRTGDVVRNLNVLLRDGTAGGLNDGQLLARFVASGDETAFSILVERHGPVVMRVCRSVLGTVADAHDAFQATFLVLVERARSRQDQASVGPWLVGASYRIATRAKIDAFRRSAHERHAAERRPGEAAWDAPPPSAVWPELYEELGRLPGKFRDPLVLCYLEGHTAEQAAERLGCPRGTILSRMARAKSRLKDRLTRRGVAFSDSALSAGLTPTSASAPLPASLTADTIRAAVQLAGRAGLSGTVALARSTVVAVGLIAATVSTFGLTLAAKPRPADPKPPPASKPPVAQATTKSEGPTNTLTIETRELTTDAPVSGVEISLNVWGGENEKLATDRDGRALFKLSKSEEIKILRPFASRDGYVPLYLNWERGSSSGLPDHFLLLMEKATTIKGRVVDEEERPVAGATVVIDARKKYPRSPQGLSVSREKVQSDADGRWSFTGVPEKPDAVELAVYHHLYLEDSHDYAYHSEEFKPLSALRDGSATLRLDRGTPVNGRVVGTDGNPVTGAMVHFKDAKPWGYSIPPVATDADGKFALGFKPGTTVNLTVLSPGHAPTRETVRVGASPVPLSIKLQPPHRLEGRLVDARGEPVTHSRVDVSSWRGFEGFEKGFITDADGRFAWDDAPADEVRATVSAIGYSAQERVALTAGASNQVVMIPQTTIKGRVVDQETGKPILAYSLTIGVVWRKNDRMIWQRGWHLNRDAERSPGGFQHTFSDSVDQYLVRVEAEGYSPADSGLLAPGITHEVAYRLKKADPIRGVVTNDDGSPPQDGYVYLVLESDSLPIDNGEVDPHIHPRTIHAKIGEDGRFALPPQIEPYALVALCRSGIAVDDRRTGTGHEALRLQPWAHLSGTITRDGRPMAETVLLSEPEQASGPAKIPMLDPRVYLTTDAQGRFALDRLQPGRHVFQRMAPNNAARRYWFVKTAALDAKPGANYDLKIGASGHLVLGSLALPPGRPWMIRKATINARGGDSSAPGYGIEITENGRFRADDVHAGEYVLKIALHEPPPDDACGWGNLVAGFSRGFTVAGKGGREPVDLGVLSPIENHERPIEIGQAAPDFELKTMDGEDVSLARLKGKYILLDFWATWCAPCIEEVPHLKAAHERFADDPRLAMISISLDEKPEDAASFVKGQRLTWPQGCVGPDSSVVADYGASAIPLTILIGPDGRVIAKDLRGERIADAIAEALRK